MASAALSSRTEAGSFIADELGERLSIPSRVVTLNNGNYKATMELTQIGTESLKGP